MFLPFDEAYRKIMNIQNNYNFSYNLENNLSCASNFSAETESLLINLLKKLISNENKIEIWRSKLNKMQMFSVKNTFSKMIDNRIPEIQFAFITKMDLNYYFSHIYNISYRCINLREDVDMIIQIFDKDKDGKISFNEVFELFGLIVIYFVLFLMNLFFLFFYFSFSLWMRFFRKFRKSNRFK